MKNIIPNKALIAEATLQGVDKARVVHSSLVDYDATAVVCYVYVVDNGEPDYLNNNTAAAIYYAEPSEVNFMYIPLPASTAGQEYVIEVAIVDELVDGLTSDTGSIVLVDETGANIGTKANALIEARNTTALLISDPVRLSKVRGAYLTDVAQVVPDSFSNSVPPYLQFELEVDGIENIRINTVTIQVGTGYNGTDLTGITWTPIYAGQYKSLLNIDSGLVGGTSYVFRVITEFNDSSTSSAEYYDSDTTTTAVEHPLIEIEYGLVDVSPPGFDALSFEAYTSWDGTPTYDLLVKWNWLGTAENYVRHYEIEYIKNNTIVDATDLSTLTWTDPSRFTVAPSSDRLLITAFPPRDRFAFRIRSVGWAADEDNGSGGSKKYSDWYYAAVTVGEDSNVTFDIIPNDGVAPTGTNIQVTNAFIRAYKNWNGSIGDITFQIDAATGNVVIGENSEFVYDAVTSRLSIDGTAIVNEIVSAAFVMDWLDGVAPSIRTVNKSGYADGGTGFWAGYTDGTTFKMDIGGDNSYIRWDGSNLSIYGGVVIDVPTDPSTLPEGSLGYTNVSLTLTNNIVIFNGEDNSLKEDPTVINADVFTTGNATFISNLVWEVLDANSVDITSTVLSDQYTGAPNTAKKITISSANGVLSNYDSIRVRVYHQPNGTETFDTSNIKDFSTIGKVRTYDSVEGIEEPFYAYLTNEAHPVPVDANNQNPSLTGATGSMKIYQGSTDLSTSPDTSYAVTNADGCTVSINSSGVYTVTAVPLVGGVPTKDNYTIRLEATYVGGTNPVTHFRDFSLFISKQGEKGDPGDTGADAQTLVLNADAYVFAFDAAGVAQAPSTVTFTANKQNIADTTVWSTSPAVTLGGTGDTRTLSVSEFGANTQVVVTATAGAYSDSITIVRVSDGDQGETGEDGYTVILTNEAHTIPSDADGNNQVLTGTGCSVYVYKGTTLLTPRDVAPASLADGEFKPTLTNSLTGMFGSVSGDAYVISDATSGIVGDTHQVTYNVNIGTGGGNYFTITKVQTFTKAKQGVTGNTGQQGTRAPVWVEGSTTLDPTQASVWTGGTGSHAYSKLVTLVGDARSYDMLTLYNETTPSLTDTYMWNGATWEAAVKINGNIIADGTIAARAIVADEGFFDDLNVNRIYNHGGSAGDYKMMIDFENGAIHIRGGS